MLSMANLLFNIASANASKKLSTFFIYHLLRFPILFFDTTPLGRILSRFSSDIYTIDKSLPPCLFMISYFTSMVGVRKN